MLMTVQRILLLVLLARHRFIRILVGPSFLKRLIASNDFFFTVMYKLLLYCLSHLMFWKSYL